jgi:hypothetical protein
MNWDSQHLTATHGYADLGLWLDASAELEQISPEFRDASEVLALRVRIYRALEKWDLMQVVARQLALRDPLNVDATISWAYAVRRADCIEAARLILGAAEANPLVAKRGGEIVDVKNFQLLSFNANPQGLQNLAHYELFISSRRNRV